jgi:predicted nucleotidyltransferase
LFWLSIEFWNCYNPQELTGDFCGSQPGARGWNLSSRGLLMGIDTLLKEKREEILRIAAKHGVARIRVFGSAARGESREGSDVDLLVEVTGPTTPWFPGGLVAELEQFLGRRVDVVEPDAIREPLRQTIMQEAIPL